MHKLITIILLLICNLTFGQEKSYKLISKKENADVNYTAFKSFNDFEIYKNDGLKRAFEPIKGGFDVYFFIAEFFGGMLMVPGTMSPKPMVLKVMKVK